MTDIERAREYAAKDAENRGHYNLAAGFRAAQYDFKSPVQAALFAIQSERERANVLVEALRDIARQHLTAEMSTDEEGVADYEDAYEIIINVARKALASWDAGNG